MPREAAPGAGDDSLWETRGDPPCEGVGPAPPPRLSWPGLLVLAGLAAPVASPGSCRRGDPPAWRVRVGLGWREGGAVPPGERRRGERGEPWREEGPLGPGLAAVARSS